MAHIKNSTINFPFASQVRSEARVMSNHRHQSIKRNNKPNIIENDVLWISVSIALTQTNHNIHQGLQHWMEILSTISSSEILTR